MNLPKLLAGRRRRPVCTRPDQPEPDRLAYLNWVATTVGEYGWAVCGSQGDQSTPGWAYSVGMWLSRQAPELIVCGLPLENAASIINAVGARVADGVELSPGMVLDDVCQAPLMIRRVDVSWRASGLLTVCDAFYGMVRPPYLQVVWPDGNDRFPLDPRHERGFDGVQPLLWLPRDDNPPSPWTRLR